MGVIFVILQTVLRLDIRWYQFLNILLEKFGFDTQVYMYKTHLFRMGAASSA